MTDRIITVDHLVDLDGVDRGAHQIGIGPSGTIASLRLGTAQRIGGDVSAVPLLADAHAHLGISDGVRDDPEFHTVAHIDAQLHHLAVMGVGHVHSLGTDQRWVVDRLRRRVDSGDPGQGAFGYSAGIGFGAVDGWPPELTLPELRFRPVQPEAARRQVRELAGLGCHTLKVWVDDFGGTVPKMPYDVASAIAAEARQLGILTFAHVKTHSDARVLVELGIDVLAHSVRDEVMGPELLDLMAAQGTTLVPTLVREEAEVAFSAASNPYLDNPFFLASEADLVPRLRQRTFSDNPDRPRRSLQVALENVAHANARGVRIGLGTDSGFAFKLLGFAQHRELELLAEAGLSPEQCLAAALGTNRALFASRMSAIEAGAPASFVLVDGDPTTDIRATQRIREVWIAGSRLPRPGHPPVDGVGEPR